MDNFEQPQDLVKASFDNGWLNCQIRLLQEIERSFDEGRLSASSVEVIMEIFEENKIG